MNLQYVQKDRNDKDKCTDIDFVAESSAERICGRRKESTDVAHTADLELLRLPLNHFSVVHSQH